MDNLNQQAWDIMRERVPSNEAGVYLQQHTHDWIEIGAEKYANGWHPVFQCLVCTDVICTDAVMREPAQA
jgi:hypothetical protein